MNIREIAKFAGVSIATVSRVINNPELVQEETRQHVLEIMKNENYIPQQSIEERCSAYARCILVIISENYSHLCTRLLAGLNPVANAKGYTSMVCTISPDVNIAQNQLKTVLSQKVAGVVVADTNINIANVAVCNQNKIPIVSTNPFFLNERSNVCYIDSNEGAYRMTKHLISLGHKRICYLGTDVDTNIGKNKINGYIRALKEFNIESEKNIVKCKPDLIGGYDKVSELINNKCLPDAFFFSDEMNALGGKMAISANKLRIPEDIALVCFAASGATLFMEPKLTVVELPISKLGATAARMLFDMIDSCDIDTESLSTQEIILQPRLRIRESCGNTKHINVSFE